MNDDHYDESAAGPIRFFRVTASVVTDITYRVPAAKADDIYEISDPDQWEEINSHQLAWEIDSITEEP